MKSRPPTPAVLAGHVVRRLRPGATEAEVAITTAWMIGQAITFLRDADYRPRPPFAIAFDAGALDDLVATLARFSWGGLGDGVHLTEI